MQLSLSAILAALIAVATLFIVAPQVVRHHSKSPGPARSPASAKASAPVSELVDGLAERMARDPGDADGWMLLARSYQFLGRKEEARDAYAKAAALGKAGPDLAAALQSDVNGRDSLVGEAAIRGRVELSASAAALVRPGDTVFVFAKAGGGAGVPVAALRKSAKDLPFDFTLTDATAVMPGARLSDLEEASVGARVSRSGRATDALEDLEAASQIVRTYSGDRIELVIGPAVSSGAAEAAE